MTKILIDRAVAEQALHVATGAGYPLALIAALKAALVEPDYCTWQQDGDSDSGLYATSCRHYFNLEDGTPEDNKMSWCCYCGKKLAQELITEDEDD
jgi:hypothetical protein